jgi:hypothetical protein
MSRKAKRPGTIEQPRGVIETRCQKVTVGRKMMILTEFHTELSTTIYIGSDTIYCIDITLFKAMDGTYMPRGILNKVRWDGECSVTDAFERGTDTVMIFKLAMTYIKNTYPTVTVLAFTDVSTKECSNGASVSLSGMKLFTDGQTWYESHFDAYIDPSSTKMYTAMMSRATEVKQTISWEEFVYCTANNHTIIGIKNVKEQFEASRTWQEFFTYVRSQMDVASFCICLSEKNWFDIFIQSRLQFNLMGVQFLIPVASFAMDYIIEPMSGGKRGIKRWGRTLRKIR